jgi:hypothetical protein
MQYTIVGDLPVLTWKSHSHQTGDCKRSAVYTVRYTKRQMTNPVCYFEVHVTDLDRAVGFYGPVFGCVLYIPIDGNQIALFPAEPQV